MLEGIGQSIGQFAGRAIGIATGDPLGAIVGGWLGSIAGKIIGKVADLFIDGVRHLAHEAFSSSKHAAHVFGDAYEEGFKTAMGH